MPWSSEQKEITRERILESAVKLFSAYGFDNVTINDVMKEAQLTHGAFYEHFN
ncbi:MAG: TetR/AcrR family transcriptional regulator [Candidatus Thiodiazotropha sp.]